MVYSPRCRLRQFIRQSKGQDWLAGAFLASLVLLFFWRIIFLGQVLLPADMIYTAEPWKSEANPKLTGTPWNTDITDAIWQHYPMAVNANLMHREGYFFWDPYPMAGMPALARGEVFANPILILFSQFMPVSRAFSWMAVLHLWIASLFMFLFLREMSVGRFGALAGSLAFAYNAYLVDWVALPNLTNTMAWLPMVAWGIERALRKQDWRWSLAGALGFGLQILSGQILLPFYAAITLTLIALYRGFLIWLEQKKFSAVWRPILYTGIALGLGALLTAPQWLLTIQLYFQTIRTVSLGASSYLDIRTQLIRLLSPTIYGTPLHGDFYRGPFNYTETTLYFGILPLFLIAAGLFSPKRKLAWGFFGIGLVTLLAVYYITPFRQIVTILYPTFIKAFPGRIFYVTAFTWAVAAGLGADWLFSAQPKRLLGWLAATAAILAAGFLVLILAQQALQGADKSEPLMNIAKLLVKSETLSLLISAVSLLIVALLFWSYYKGLIRPGWFAGLALALIVADLFYAGMNYNPTFHSRWVFPEVPSVEFLEELRAGEDQPYRVLNVNSGLILLGGTPQLYRLPTISGYSSWVLERFSEYADLTQSRGKTPPVFVYFTDCCHSLIDALNVKYIYVSQRVHPTALGIFDLVTRLDQARKESPFKDEIFASKWLQDDGTKIPAIFVHPPARLDYNIYLPAPVTFTASIALDQQAWKYHNDGIQFEIYANPVGGDPELLFSRTINPKQNPAERQPIPLQVDLSRYVGKEIVLSLVTTSGSKDDNQNDWAMWIQPQIQSYLPNSLELVYDGENKVYENKEALPRAWIVHQIQQVPVNDIEAVKEKLGDPHFDPASQAVVETSQPIGNLARSPLATDSSRAIIRDYTPEKVVVEASLQQPGLLVLSDVMYPGWKAFVDGKPKPILTTNLVMRGVLLDKGDHQVVFVFRPDLFYIGLVASVGALLIVMVAWIWSKLRSARLRVTS